MNKPGQEAKMTSQGSEAHPEDGLKGDRRECKRVTPDSPRGWVLCPRLFRVRSEGASGARGLLKISDQVPVQS